jgi:hypothetical protein
MRADEMVLVLRESDSATVRGVTVRVVAVLGAGQARVAIEAPPGIQLSRQDRFDPDTEPADPPKVLLTRACTKVRYSSGGG